MAAAPSTLKELYTADMRDLCSANDQMQKVVQAFSEKATDPKLKQLFGQSVTGIGQHTQALRAMMDADSDSPCPGMQGLVQEATQHALQSDLPPQLRDLEMIAQYQRMSHYGLAGCLIARAEKAVPVRLPVRQSSYPLSRAGARVGGQIGRGWSGVVWRTG